MAHVITMLGNMFAFKGSYQAEVTVGENENGESAIRRFRRAVMSSGHINEVRLRSTATTPHARFFVGM